MVAIVVPLGFALWAFANSSVGASVEAQGQRVSSDINTIKEKFVIVNIATTTSPSSVTFYVYNNGVVKTSIVAIYCGTASPTTLVPAASITPALPAPIDMGKLQSFTFTVSALVCPFSTGDTMYVKVVGQYGTAATYFQRVP